MSHAVDLSDNITEMIRSTIGSDNVYLYKLVSDRLSNKPHHPTIPIISPDRSGLKALLKQMIEVAQQETQLSEPLSETSTTSGSTSSTITSTSKLITSILMEAKLRDRESLESANRVKYLNGVLAIILPIVVGLIEFIITRWF